MKTILIADDSSFMRQWLKNIIETHDYHVTAEARNGEEAIEQYRRHRPDIVLLDVTMPRVGGIEALQGIMSVNPEAAVVMCSSMATSSYVREAKEAGAKDFVAKPHFNNLIDILNRIGVDLDTPR